MSTSSPAAPAAAAPPVPAAGSPPPPPPAGAPTPLNFAQLLNAPIEISAAVLGLGVTVVGIQSVSSWSIRLHLYLGLGCLFLSFFVTWFAIAMKKDMFKGRGPGLEGEDLCRRRTTPPTKIPSGVGLFSGVVFIVFVILEQVVSKLLGWWGVTDCNGSDLTMMLQFSTALMSICFVVILGFADDVFNLEWWYKYFFPFVASLPLLIAFTGSTTVVVPAGLRGLVWSGSAGGGAGGSGCLPCSSLWSGASDGAESGALTLFGGLINCAAQAAGGGGVCHGGAQVSLGVLFFVFLLALAVFNTNAINIYAGINGLEVGQSVVIVLFILIINIGDLINSPAGLGDSASVGECSDPRMFSALLAMPFLGASLGLLIFNWYPARVFGGDTFCYFAGMTIACMAILGHFSKTLLLLIVPQIFNFVYSGPQLFKFAFQRCWRYRLQTPRHRMPGYDAEHDVLIPSLFNPTAKKDEDCSPEFRRLHWKTNFTLINLILDARIALMRAIYGADVGRNVTGIHERTMTLVLIALQVVCCCVGLYVRSFFI